MGSLCKMNAPIPAHWENFRKRDKLAVADTGATILRDPIGEVARNAKHREPMFKPCRNAQVVEAVFEIPGHEMQGVVLVRFEGSESSRRWEMSGGGRAEKGINSPGVSRISLILPDFSLRKRLREDFRLRPARATFRLDRDVGEIRNRPMDSEPEWAPERA